MLNPPPEASGLLDADGTCARAAVVCIAPPPTEVTLALLASPVTYPIRLNKEGESVPSAPSFLALFGDRGGSPSGGVRFVTIPRPPLELELATARGG
jgi:hypothetical protein